MFHQITLVAVPDFPLVEPGNQLAAMISDACLKAGIALGDGDVVVMAPGAEGIDSLRQLLQTRRELLFRRFVELWTAESERGTFSALERAL